MPHLDTSMKTGQVMVTSCMSSMGLLVPPMLYFLITDRADWRLLHCLKSAVIGNTSQRLERCRNILNRLWNASGWCAQVYILWSPIAVGFASGSALIGHIASAKKSSEADYRD